MTMQPSLQAELFTCVGLKRAESTFTASGLLILSSGLTVLGNVSLRTLPALRGSKSRRVTPSAYRLIRLRLASVHKCLRICDLCKELGIFICTRNIAAERERQAKTDACLVPLCPLASMVPVFWRGFVWWQPQGIREARPRWSD